MEACFLIDFKNENNFHLNMSFLMWNPDLEDKPTTQIPLTILCGFLGAGKTTLLNKILATSTSQKIAVIVNDLGEVNIDASLIKSAVKEEDGAIAGMLELQGGCICCSIQTDLLDGLLKVSQRFQPEHIIIEATGVAEPGAILGSLYTKNFFGRSVMDFLKVANMVTVVDGGNLEHYLEPPKNMGMDERTHHYPDDDPHQPLPLEELLMEQIECADILLINKVDVLEDVARQRFRGYLESLNQSAEIWESSFAQIDVERLMIDHRFSEEKTLKGATWRHAILDNDQDRRTAWKNIEKPKKEKKPPVFDLLLAENKPQHGFLMDSINHSFCDYEKGAQEKHHHKDYGLETFVFNGRTQFKEAEFLKVLQTGLTGVLRAKGFYWTDRVPSYTCLLSLSGKMFSTDYLAEWWYTKVERGEVDLDEIPEIAKKSWLPVFGDRRQELVFIGIDLDRELIEKTLMDCFVNEKAGAPRLP